MGEEITILKEDFEEMQRELYMLECLRAAGVDNWDGYDYAIDEYRKKYPESD